MKTPEQNQGVRRIPLAGWFKALPEPLRLRLLGEAREIHFSKGDWIYSATENAGGLFGVIEGAIGLYSTLTRGEARILDVVGPGTWFGQVGMLRDAQRQITAIAAQDSSTLLVHRSSLLQLLRKEAEFVDAVLRLDLKNFQYLLRAHAENLSLPPRGRIAGRLHALAGRMAHAPVTRVIVTQADLAAMIGLERKTVHRILKEFEERNLIRQCYGAIEVRSRRGLAQVRDEIDLGPSL